MKKLNLFRKKTPRATLNTPGLNLMYWSQFQQKAEHRNTIFKILEANGQHSQALQNFNHADRHHIDKAIHELNSAKDRLTLLLMQSIKEVQDRA